MSEQTDHVGGAGGGGGGGRGRRENGKDIDKPSSYAPSISHPRDWLRFNAFANSLHSRLCRNSLVT